MVPKRSHGPVLTGANTVTVSGAAGADQPVLAAGGQQQPPGVPAAGGGQQEQAGLAPVQATAQGAPTNLDGSVASGEALTVIPDINDVLNEEGNQVKYHQIV